MFSGTVCSRKCHPKQIGPRRGARQNPNDDPARSGTVPPPWSQAWGTASQANGWWPGKSHEVQSGSACLPCVCLTVCVCVSAVGKLSQRDADCVESQRQQTPETHCTSLSILHCFTRFVSQMDSLLTGGGKKAHSVATMISLSLSTHTHTTVPSFHHRPFQSVCSFTEVIAVTLLNVSFKSANKGKGEE